MTWSSSYSLARAAFDGFRRGSGDSDAHPTQITSARWPGAPGLGLCGKRQQQPAIIAADAVPCIGRARRSSGTQAWAGRLTGAGGGREDGGPGSLHGGVRSKGQPRGAAGRGAASFMPQDFSRL